MPKDQKHNNRSQGQRIRRTNENLDGLIDAQAKTAEVVSQHDRDIKMMKARITDLEREKSSDRRTGGWLGKR